MMQATSWFLQVIGAVLSGMALLLLVEALVAWRRPRTPKLSPAPVSYAVLIPAHDEALVIEGTVRAALAQLGPHGRLLVVADNCVDDTATRARLAGAEVVERRDPTLRAKGYALAHGISYLAANAPPVVVIMLDADCRCAPGSFDALSRQASAEDRPVQAVNLMLAPAGAGLRVRFAAFAWAFKNSVRPRGLAGLGLPCQLTGTGMAIPWGLLGRVNFATSSITEDLQIGLRFASVDRAPLFSTAARIESFFASTEVGLDSQRKRWEHGHLQTIATLAPKLLWTALRDRSAGLLALVLDMSVPPLALFAVLLSSYACLLGLLSAAAMPLGSSPLLALAALWAFGTAVLIGWWQEGRQWITPAELLTAPIYMLRKIPLYFSFITGRQTEWTRTHRGQ